MDEKEIQENFLGKPYEIVLKGIDKKDYRFRFEQLEVDDLPEFMPLIDEWVKSEGKINPDIIKKSLPFVRKMMKLSYPEWKEELRELFIKRNVLVLIGLLFDINLITLTTPVIAQKDDEELNQFIQAERDKLKKDGKS